MYDALFTQKQDKRQVEAFNYLSSTNDYNSYLMLESMMKKAERDARWFNHTPDDSPKSFVRAAR